ncbi:MAG TPA: 50S ribosomal protein L29 [Kiritimatiellia bacterium]|nr:50S ribosomal protein L29 [Kiritimatiellia bacterium]HRZ13669.1 50S ribosomal protein L29 [Kiritimatiellia bacterium]HSA19235.1 50S ribosomal protein L29 [Kiritimatiellia bacterium]
MKTSELKELTADELRQRLEESQQELFNLRVQQATGQMEKASRLKTLRRDIARVLTLLQQRQKAGR